MNIKTFILGWLILSQGSNAAVITFDLRNMGETIHGSFTLRMEGVTLSFSPDEPGNGVLVSTTLGLGIDSGYAGEVSGFINGRTGVGTAQGAESVFFMFSHDVVVQSVILAWQGQGAVPVIEPKSVAPSEMVLGNGTTLLPDLQVGRTSANRLYHAGTGIFPANGGFTIQSITVATVPEPASMLSGLLATGFCCIRRKR